MPRRLWVRLAVGSLLCLLVAGAPAAASAQPADTDGDGIPDASDACPKEPGVSSSDPKTSGCAPKVGGVVVKERAEATFIGYRDLPGNRGMVFVELTGALAVEVSRNAQVVEYRLVGASVPLKNNRNPLLLSDFDSSALSAQLVLDKPLKGRKKQKHPQPSARLVVRLRDAASPSPAFRMVQHGKGATLEVELGQAQ